MKHTSNSTPDEEDLDRAASLDFTTVTVADDDGVPREAIHVDVTRNDERKNSCTPLDWATTADAEEHQRLLDACEAAGVDTDVIEFAAAKDVRTDDDGRPYVGDLNGLVRYYLGVGEVEPTGKYDDLKKVADGTQRKTDFEQLVNHPA